MIGACRNSCCPKDDLARRWRPLQRELPNHQFAPTSEDYSSYDKRYYSDRCSGNLQELTRRAFLVLNAVIRSVAYEVQYGVWMLQTFTKPSD